MDLKAKEERENEGEQDKNKTPDFLSLMQKGEEKSKNGGKKEEMESGGKKKNYRMCENNNLA